MRLGEICIRDVVCADRNTPVHDAARLMRARHVGNVVVVEQRQRGSVPVGIVTDRDIVIEVLAEHIDASALTLGDIITNEIITAPEDQDVFETIRQMQTHGIRRLPVVDRQGHLVGIVTVDDLLEFLAIHFSELSKVIARERMQEVRARPA